jgi:hypothetical protein
MKKVALTFIILLTASMQVRAQGLPGIDAQASLGQTANSANTVPTPQQRSADIPEMNIELPDAPMPKDLAHERGPCPAGNNMPCALLGGYRFYERTTLTEHDKTWGQAMKRPIMWVSATALVLSTAYDIEGTQACLKAHACSEGNPIMGKHPSRARMCGTAMPVNAITIFAMGKLKKQGHGYAAVFIASILSFTHCYLGMSAFAAR